MDASTNGRIPQRRHLWAVRAVEWRECGDSSVYFHGVGHQAATGSHEPQGASAADEDSTGGWPHVTIWE